MATLFVCYGSNYGKPGESNKWLLLGFYLLYFIGNFDFGKPRKEYMFTEHMLDKHAFGHDNKAKEVLEDIKTFNASFVRK